MAAVYIFLGGGFGSLSRYGIGLLFPSSLSHIGTLVANTLACLLLGVFVGLAAHDILKDHHKLLAVTGFCGGFSTFSTFSNELIELHNTQNISIAILHMIMSIVIGIGCVLIGMWFSSQWAGVK